MTGRMGVLALRSSKVALLAALALTLVMGWSPLLAVHGVESALCTSLVLLPFVSIAGARVIVAARRQGLGRPASAILGRLFSVGLSTFAVAFVVLALHALHARQCTPFEGAMFMLLGPGVTLPLAALSGGVAAAALRPAWAGTLVAALIPVAVVARGVAEFYGSPSISVYAHLVGWFPGTIYDEALSIPTTLITFRVLGVCLGCGLALLFAALYAPRRGVLALRRGLLRPFHLGAGALLLLACGGGAAYGEELGHRTSSAHIEKALGATRHGARCIVHAPRELDHEELRRLVKDCDFRVATLEEDLGVTQRVPVVAFFFRNAEEKQRYMGAGRTFIAKPWRNEVYLQLEGWPHPVLAHEVAHVIAGNAAEGPFRVGGSLGGWLPNPALIEGMAVALSWQPREGLTRHQLAHAMLELDEMPSLESVMGLDFLLRPPRSAYETSGSFLRYLLDTYGKDAVRRAHRTGDLEAAFEKPLASLEKEWHGFLRKVPLPDGALALARVRFERKSIFSAVCPRKTSELRQTAAVDRAAGDDRALIKTCKTLLEIDPRDAYGRTALVGALSRRGQSSAAEHQLALLEGALDAPTPYVVAAREAMADALFVEGKGDPAASIYRALLDEPKGEDRARQLEVKLLALEAGGRQTQLLGALLLGRNGRGSPGPVAVHLARELTNVRPDGLGPYLEARQLYFQRDYDRMLWTMRRARKRGLPTERLAKEAESLEGVALFATGRLTEARTLYQAIATRSTASPAEREIAEEWLRRIAWTRR